MENPTCTLDSCGEEISDEETFVNISGGTVHRGEPQGDAGGGIFHPECAVAYIESNYQD